MAYNALVLGNTKRAANAGVNLLLTGGSLRWRMCGLPERQACVAACGSAAGSGVGISYLLECDACP